MERETLNASFLRDFVAIFRVTVFRSTSAFLISSFDCRVLPPCVKSMFDGFRLFFLTLIRYFMGLQF